MTTHDGDHFQCNECGRRMRWSPAIAGRTGRCKCGAVVRVPEAIEPPAEVDLLDALAQPTAPVVEASIAYNAPAHSASVLARPRQGCGQRHSI